MLRSAKGLTGLEVKAVDGNIGAVDDLFFDDEDWVVRYLVIETGKWLPGRKVIVSPTSAGEPDTEKNEIPVSLDRKKIEDSPTIDEEQPVSRRQEIKLAEYFGWPYYWWGPVGMAAGATRGFTSAENAPDATEDEDGDPNLRSLNEVSGYSINAKDGEFGHIEDLIVETDGWEIVYAVVDTRNWLPGKKVLITPGAISNVDWAANMISVDMPAESIEKSPEFDPSQPVNRKLEVRLYDYMGRPVE